MGQYFKSNKKPTRLENSQLLKKPKQFTCRADKNLQEIPQCNHPCVFLSVMCEPREQKICWQLLLKKEERNQLSV